MSAPSQPEVTVVTPDAVALMDLHLGNAGIPDMHP